MIARVRLAARARAITGAPLPRWGWVQERGPRVALAAAAGATAAGTTGAIAGAVVGVAWPRIAARRAAGRRERALQEQIPEVLRSIAAAIRAGRSLPQALEAARDEAAEPVREALALALGRLEVGGSLDEAIATFEGAAGGELARDAARTLAVARTAGGNVAAVIDLAVASAVERVRIARDRAAATSQARMSALIVGGMPVAFYALIGSGARERLFELLREPVGWVVVGLGVVLEAAGVLWMRAVTSR